MKVYRHIFFRKGIMQNGTGSEDVRYYGQMYSNCESMRNFREKFDGLLDLYVSCNDCARAKYRNFVRISRPNS